jgi:WD40 repeat protein
VIRELKGPKLRVYSVAFSPDGSLLVAGTGADDPKEQCDARAHVWDLRAGRHIRSLAGFGRSIYDVAIADDGTVFACGYRNAVYIWPPGQDEPVRHRPRGTQFRIWALDLSPDGRRLVIAAPDLAVRLLDVATGEEVLALPWAPPAKTACFSPNGRYVAAGSYHSSGKLRVWDRAPACDRVASVSVRHWHDQLDGDWDAVRVAIRDDQLLLDRQKLEAHAHVKRLAPWFSSSGGDRARRNRHESRLAEQTSPPQ